MGAVFIMTVLFCAIPHAHQGEMTSTLNRKEMIF
jgi:hypothetical protein